MISTHRGLLLKLLRWTALVGEQHVVRGYALAFVQGLQVATTEDLVTADLLLTHATRTSRGDVHTATVVEVLLELGIASNPTDLADPLLPRRATQ